jgi:hypothetical protein
MSERMVPGEQGLDGRRAENQSSEIGSDANAAQEEEEYLLFTNSSRSYFQFQVKMTDSSK